MEMEHISRVWNDLPNLPERFTLAPIQYDDAKDDVVDASPLPSPLPPLPATNTNKTTDDAAPLQTTRAVHDTIQKINRRVRIRSMRHRSIREKFQQTMLGRQAAALQQEAIRWNAELARLIHASTSLQQQLKVACQARERVEEEYQRTREWEKTLMQENAITEDVLRSLPPE